MRRMQWLADDGLFIADATVNQTRSAAVPPSHTKRAGLSSLRLSCLDLEA